MKIFSILFVVTLLISKPAVAFDQKKVHQIIKKNYSKFLILEGYNAVGKAVVYSDKFHKRKTASSIKHLTTAYTAASVKLPLMSVVKVTNNSNGKSVFVLINDRGPSKTNAVLDLSKAAAEGIALHSRDKIDVEFDLSRTLELANNTGNLKSFGI